ncbi:MAG TPA: hypothetical protein VN840_01125 [Streptosporangiaceae bacterium]|nr:hypothetical protein [Streptosporangiaceae bacterium]
MSVFLLLGSRPQTDREVSPAGVARDVAAAAAWCRSLRRWGLLSAFALAPEPVTGLRACLIVRASCHAAAERLASDWGQVSGYQVSVTRLCAAAPGSGGGR